MLKSTPTYDKLLGAEVVLTSLYLKNRQPHKSITDQTVYEVSHCNKPSITHLKPFGCECYVHISKQQRLMGSRLQPKTHRGIFAGYAHNKYNYRIHLPESKQQIISNDIFFLPSKIEWVS